MRVAVERLWFDKVDSMRRQWDIRTGRIGRWYIVRRKFRWVMIHNVNQAVADGWISRKMFVHPNTEHVDTGERKADKTSSLLLPEKFTSQLVIWLILEGHLSPEEM